MFELLPIEYLAIFSLAISLISITYAMHTSRSARKLNNTLKSHIDELGKELNTLNHSTLGMGRRLQSMHDKQQSLGKDVDEIQKNDPVKVSYSEAARLVKMGANVNELMSACGISRPEAELVSALTKQQTSSQGAKEQSEQGIPVLSSK